MPFDEQQSRADRTPSEGVRRLTDRLGEVLARCDNPRDVFLEFTRLLQAEYDIRKGLLALRDGALSRFLAVATWNQGKIRRNLSLKLPSGNSLFEKVAEHGQIYSDNFAELFDGNLIERQLLLDADTRSFMLRPLKCDGQVAGLLGYSSNNPDAFVMFEEGLIDPILDRFGRMLGRIQLQNSEVFPADDL